MRFNPTLSAFAIAAAMSLPAFAGRPLQTEDAGVLEPAGCEIEGAHERLRDSGFTARGSSLSFNCGIGLASQLGVTGGRAKAEGQSSTSWALGGKTQLWRGEGDDAAALTLAWSVAYERAAGKMRHSVDEAALVASLPAGPGTVHLNIGHVRDRIARQTSAPWGVAYEHVGFDAGGVRLAPMGEFFGDDRGTRFWNLALRVTLVPEKVFVDGSYGRQIGSGSARLLTVGFKIAF